MGAVDGIDCVIRLLGEEGMKEAVEPKPLHGETKGWGGRHQGREKEVFYTTEGGIARKKERCQEGGGRRWRRRAKREGHGSWVGAAGGERGKDEGGLRWGMG